MELETVIEILEKHQAWRRDPNVPPKTEMQSPIEIGTAIDFAISELKKLRLSDVVRQSEQLKCQCTKTDKYYDPIGDVERCQKCEKAL